jgi:uncharacterized protein (TIGR02611 family)
VRDREVEASEASAGPRSGDLAPGPRSGDLPPAPGGEPAASGPSQRERRPGRAARMAEELHERRERHLQRSKAYRLAVIVAGFLVVAAGIVLSGPGVPGPGFLVILIGLALLALEFAWAERLMRRALRYVEKASQRASDQSTRTKVIAGVAVALAAAAAVGAIIVFDIPIPPFD